jgi:bacteriorhodopsin
MDSKTNYIKRSYYITYTALLITAILTFIESIRNENHKIRTIMNLLTIGSIVAAFFYIQFINNNENDKQINLTRYTDWMITSPIMLLVLCLVMVYNTNNTLSTPIFLLILIINYCMLGSAYAGELNVIPKIYGTLWRWILFILLYSVIYYNFLHKNYNRDNSFIFSAFVVLSGLYGIIYNNTEENRIIGYNILDLLSKSFIGIFLWIYLSK